MTTMYFPGEPVTVITTAGELPVVEAVIDDGVYRVQVEDGEFPVMLLGEWAMRPGADVPVIVEG